MIEGIPDWVSVPLLVFGLFIGGMAVSLVRGNRFVRRLHPPRGHQTKRAILRKVQKRK